MKTQREFQDSIIKIALGFGWKHRIVNDYRKEPAYLLLEKPLLLPLSPKATEWENCRILSVVCLLNGQGLSENQASYHMHCKIKGIVIWRPKWIGMIELSLTDGIAYEAERIENFLNTSEAVAT